MGSEMCIRDRGKVFIFSNKQDGLWQFVRVNDQEKHMRDQEIQVFDLVDGENNVYAFGRIFGDEVNSLENAIAVGPLNIVSIDLADVLSTAIFAKLFLATLKDVLAFSLREFLKDDISSTVKPSF